jgi:hypothetical protein
MAATAAPQSAERSSNHSLDLMEAMAVMVGQSLWLATTMSQLCLSITTVRTELQSRGVAARAITTTAKKVKT